MQTKLVEIKIKNGKVQLFVKGQEAEVKDFNELKGKSVEETKTRYGLTDSEYMTACFEIRRSLNGWKSRMKGISISQDIHNT